MQSHCSGNCLPRNSRNDALISPSFMGSIALAEPSVRGVNWWPAGRGISSRARKRPIGDLGDEVNLETDRLTDVCGSNAAVGIMTAGSSLVLGSVHHKEAFCRMLLDTHDPYRPAVIPWPQLDADASARLTTLPIWNIAVQVEGRAARAVQSYADRVADPLLREAIALDGREEARHKEVLGKMVAFYGITLDPEPDYPAPPDPEWAWLCTGYSECIDSFFAFGLFEFARRSGFFPPALIETFEPVIQEECRHILFFVNWLAWHRRQLRPLARMRFNLRCFLAYLSRIKGRLQTARQVEGNKNFTAKASKAVAANLRVGDLLRVCLAENDRRMMRYDARLIRPRFVPFLVKVALIFVR